MPGIDLSNLYHLRKNFTIIAVTGRTGSGCSTIAAQLAKGFSASDFPSPTFGLNHNSYRKFKIVYNYAEVNFKPYQLIKYPDVLALFILEHGYDALIEYLSSPSLKLSFRNSELNENPDYSVEVAALATLEENFKLNKQTYDDIDFNALKHGDNFKKLHEFFFGPKYNEFLKNLNEVLQSVSVIKRNKLYQVISNNLRKSGNPYDYNPTDSLNIFTIAERIKSIIKAHRKIKSKLPTKIVIDSLRNPFEIMFFKQRFSAFYLIAINRGDSEREKNLKSMHPSCYNDVFRLIEEEYDGAKDEDFYKQNVKNSIEKADIHISYITEEVAISLNTKREKNKDNVSPYYSWKMQLLKYVSLIDHPGIVTPSPEERCMQLAFTAKCNSGCISRQVGAAITDENYSIKAIGWNNTPEGQVPCNLRNVEDLLNKNGDVDAFTPFELENDDFRDVLKAEFPLPILNPNVTGMNVCYCFKTLKNSYSEGKNQVHTRSLHAEESAFLQLAKYGSSGIKGGKLFTTASPCELCSKKAYQLGIQVIYYVDPYPGISEKQILEAGTKKPELRLFNGAIGNAYHWLYEPLMPYKNELALRLGKNIQDLTSKNNTTIKQQAEKIEELNRRLAKYENQV